MQRGRPRPRRRSASRHAAEPPHQIGHDDRIGPELAQVALHFGANDVDGTVMVERIVHMAGAKTQQETQQDTLVTLIQGAGRIPVERDTVYNELRRWEPQSPAGAR